MLQNLSFHLKIITGLSRLPALLSAFIPPYLDQQETPNGQHTFHGLWTQPLLCGLFFFCFAQVCRHYLKGLQFSRQLSTARAQRDVPWPEGTLPQSMMASFSHHHGTIVRLGSSLMWNVWKWGCCVTFSVLVPLEQLRWDPAFHWIWWGGGTGKLERFGMSGEQTFGNLLNWGRGKNIDFIKRSSKWLRMQ